MFHDIGWLALRTDLLEPERDIRFMLRSSAYGTVSHSHADQNSFVIEAFGEPLAVPSGLYNLYSSAHHHGWTRQTKAHCAVTFDGAGQIARSDDASAAYGERVRRCERTVLCIDWEWFVVVDRMVPRFEAMWTWHLHAARHHLDVGSITPQGDDALVTVLVPHRSGQRRADIETLDAPGCRGARVTTEAGTTTVWVDADDGGRCGRWMSVERRESGTMFGRRIELFKLFGFSVRMDASWFILAVLITWTLATSVFPGDLPGLAPRTYWWMGAVGMLGLFASIVFHEMAHSVVARRQGMPMKGITLFVFGGVAEMERESPGPGAEFRVAAAGPLATVALAGLFKVLQHAALRAPWPMPVLGVLGYLTWINTILLAFNLLPAFPLDGGRMVRAALWRWKGSMGWATRLASTVGSGFGWALVALGVVRLLGGNFVGGLWYALIGLFLRNAAGMSYQRLLVRRALEGEQVRRFMTTHPVTVPAGITVKGLVEEYVYRHHYKMLPVMEGVSLVGCVSTRQLRDLPLEEWSTQTAGQLAEPCSGDNSIAPDADATQAMAQMSRTGQSRLLVVEDGRLVGVLALKDLLEFLNLKIELEGDGSQVRPLDEAAAEDRAAEHLQA